MTGGIVIDARDRVKKTGLLRLFRYIIVCLSCCAVPLHAASSRFEFKKTTIEAGGTDTVGGFIYFKDNAGGERSVYFSVTYPVSQIMTFTKKETYIYYPEEKKCIILVNRDEISNFSFIEPAEKKADFSALGLKPVSAVKQGDKTTETWLVPEAGNSPVKRIMTEKDKKGRILKFEVRKQEGTIISRMQYSDYRTVDGRDVPFDVLSYTDQGKTGLEERFTLKDPVIDPVLPGIINDFKLPAGTKIERIEMK